MDMERLVGLVDASHALNQTLAEALREIDRMALNALVLVKRQGNALAGYGVVAQAFRERAAFLKDAAEAMQALVSPLIQTQMRILEYTRMRNVYVNHMPSTQEACCPSLAAMRQQWVQSTTDREAEARALLEQLLHAVGRVQEGIADQEYVVVNGRIEAALSRVASRQLTRVSQDMGTALGKVNQAINQYRHTVEAVYHENSTRI